jgi:methionyl-tRNA formyltransferase
LGDVCRRDSIPLVGTDNVNGPEAIASIAADEPDVIIGLGTRILSKALLKIPRIGTLNAHSSLLPDYRGGTTEFWQMACGEVQTGVTIHWMVPRVDEGEICSQRRWPIPPGTDHHRLRLLSLFNRLEQWREVVEALLAGDVPRRRQPSAKTPTFRHPSLQQQYEFYCLGQRHCVERETEGSRDRQPTNHSSTS